MSFEGYYQTITTDGELKYLDVYTFDLPPNTKYWRIVDVTNGEDEDDQRTLEAPLTWDEVDEEKQDHHGNKYYVKKRINYRPIDIEKWGWKCLKK